ncbi:hypothetical protein AVEN_126936-1 [Araneus ventricosus]|uniref:Ig-like domain-containing protein n=1 Tax=Araneus ventricosus TaxID=182803 RepID=A0A4Y2VNC7_ARAVE|nr:hypothetical protein AVEN_126936-1 [Araneus ventricosus]
MGSSKGQCHHLLNFDGQDENDHESHMVGCAARRARSDQDSLFFSPQPEDVTAIEGYPTTLKCGSSEKANVTIYWTLDGQRVENDTRRHMVGSDLYISRVSTLYDIGEFKCIATNITSGRSIVSRGSQINILCKYSSCYS